jgi:hypothetical protein
MSSLSSVSSSANSSYAGQLAQTSAFERSLYNLGTAVQNGDMTSASSILTALIAANPQYATSSSTSSTSGTSTPSSSTQSQDPLNQDFQNLASAISSNQPDAAKTAWTQLKNDLAKAGITNISSGTTLAAQAVAQNNLAMQQDLLSALFSGESNSASSSPSLVSLLGGSSNSSSTSSATDSVNAALSNWMTYQADGSASTLANTDSSTDGLNTVA